MIEIKRCNYITGDTPSISFGLSRIVDFLETSGRNIIFLHNNNLNKANNIKHFINTSKLDFHNINQFSEILDNRSNLFRVDLIIIDLLHINQISSILDYKQILDKIGIDFIILSNKYHYKTGDDVRIYKIEREPSDDVHWRSEKYFITEKVDGWKSTIDDLIVSYRRDKKIDDIFGKEGI